ncbi:MAG: polysaccharide biosynthesis protein [Clostridiales Family XIII bacterium]|jgi:FlaA1/EpsC-like NDP-sugar epimerase|nr:polysaccharide biosynthesis protein [Clostridiales Family XIII bacterium]
MVKYIRIAALVIIDAIAVNISFILAYLMRFDFHVESESFLTYISAYADNIFILTSIEIVVFFICGLYQSLWRYAGAEEIVKIFATTGIAILACISYMQFMQQSVPRSVFIMSFILNVFFVGGVRIAYRLFRTIRQQQGFNLRNILIRFGRLEFVGGRISKVMVVGAGDAGASMIREIRRHPEYGKKVVAAIDDDPSKKGKRIIGVKIAGNRKEIRAAARRCGADEIIIAIPSATKKEIQSIVNECNKTRCKLKILPGLIDLINENVSINTLRDVDIEDLLGRDPVQVNLREISGYIEGRIVMVTGGGGSIGSELCRQIATFRPRRLVAVDIYENSIFELAEEMRVRFPALAFEVAVASVRSKGRMEDVFRKYMPHVIFHAAAHKHVPLMEMNPKEAVVNNILGTANMVALADAFAVERFVMISTDKAVNPTNVMGATKRIAEMLLQEKSQCSKTTRFTAVRFGNVLGSNGSVIPIFRKQIENGGPVTVTHPDVTRYFMTIPEAVQLVIQAGAMAERSGMFILDMGEPIRIMDLAENVIRLSGYRPYEDIDIVITKLRPGEKLHEELILKTESAKHTSHEKIFTGTPPPPSEALLELLRGDRPLEEVVYGSVMKMKDEEVKEWLRCLAPSYTIMKKNPEMRGVVIEHDEESQ